MLSNVYSTKYITLVSVILSETSATLHREEKVQLEKREGHYKDDGCHGNYCFHHSAGNYEIAVSVAEQLCVSLNTTSYFCCLRLKIEDVGGVFSPSCSSRTLKEKLENVVSLDLTGANVTSFEGPAHEKLLPKVERITLKKNFNFLLKTLPKILDLDIITHLDVSGVNLGKSSEDLNEIVKQMARLESIDLTDTRLETFSFSALINSRKLSTVKIAENPLKTLGFNHDILSSLGVLDASNCELSSLDWDGPKLYPTPNLREVDLSSNSLRVLPEFFVRSLRNVGTINLKGNQIDTKNCSFYYLWKFLFINDHMVIEADFEKNSIQKPTLTSCTWAECPFECSCYEETKTVDCSSRGLSKVPEIGPSDTETLLLQGNALGSSKLKALYEMDAWCSLKLLNLSDNVITRIVSEEGEFRGTCRCLHRPEMSICFLPKLQTLILSDNEIASFLPRDWAFIQHVFNVDLSNNELQSSFLENPPSQSFSYINILNLSFNMVKNITIRGMLNFPYLISLNLSHNEIEFIDGSFIELLPQLTTLDLSFNRLKNTFMDDVFFDDEDPYSSSYPRVKNLYLNNNQLTTLNATLWTNLEELTLGNNEWNCSSDSVYNIQEFIWNNMRPKVVSSLGGVRCTTGTRILDVPLARNKIEYAGHYQTQSFSLEKKFIIFGSVAVVIVTMLICLGTPLRRFTKNIIRTATDISDVNHRSFHVFVDHCKEDREEVTARVIDQLRLEGIRVCSNDDYMPGQTRHSECCRLLRDSQKLLVVVTRSYFCSELRNERFAVLDKGLGEKFSHTGFKVAALFMDEIHIPRDLPPMVQRFFNDRVIIRYQERDWLISLRRFLEVPSDTNTNRTTQQSTQLPLTEGIVNESFVPDRRTSDVLISNGAESLAVGHRRVSKPEDTTGASSGLEQLRLYELQTPQSRPEPSAPEISSQC